MLPHYQNINILRPLEPGQLADKALLRRIDFIERLPGRKPGGFVDFRERLHFPRLGRPLDFESVAGNGIGVDFAFERPAVNGLSRFELNWLQRDKSALRLGSGFFFEFADRGIERIFTGMEFAFGDRPASEVFAFPERPARMHEQYPQRGLFKEQDSGALLHGEVIIKPDGLVPGRFPQLDFIAFEV